eukprot:TRINITY_DN62646_c0_g1_i1.p1 TRINITY_DN62646_c0_g1~~TRINITY_DN62646_c0_g1_i1.p1  ORF type:complete len:578 (+),score=87.57 TRINITY_DN62646_c0_g1_i1:31-1764(+)
MDVPSAVPGEGLVAATSAEGSTAAPDTPVSSDVSAPSAGGTAPPPPSRNSLTRRPIAVSANRPSSRAGNRAVAEKASMEKDAPDAGAQTGTRSVPAPGAPAFSRSGSALASMLLHRPVGSVASLAGAQGTGGIAEGVLPPRARSPCRILGTRASGGCVSGSWRPTPVSPSAARTSRSSDSAARSGRTAPAAAASGATSGAARSAARSPSRSRNNSPGRPGGSPPRASRAGASSRRNAAMETVEALEKQKAFLEWQVDEASRSQMALERMLNEERSRGAADRAKLAALGARIEQLEQTRSLPAPHLAEVQGSPAMHSELEAQSRQIEILQQQVERLRPQDPSLYAQDMDSRVASQHHELREENLHLRRDLEQSREMLSRYIAEMASVMPGMQKVLQKFNSENETCRSPRPSKEQWQNSREEVVSHLHKEADLPQQSGDTLSSVQQPQPQTLLSGDSSALASPSGSGLGRPLVEAPGSATSVTSKERTGRGSSTPASSGKPIVAFGSRTTATACRPSSRPVTPAAATGTGLRRSTAAPLSGTSRSGGQEKRQLHRSPSPPQGELQGAHSVASEETIRWK